MPLLSFKGFLCTPFGNADLLIKVLTDPASRRTLRIVLLLTAPTYCISNRNDYWSTALEFNLRV